MYLRQAKVILISYGAAVLVYVGLTLGLKLQNPPPAADLKILPWIFLFLAAALFFVGPVIERRVAQGKPGSSGAPGDSPFLRGAIISAAFGESIGLFGLVYWFLSGNRPWVWIFAALSLGYLWLLYGRLEELYKATAAQDEGKESGREEIR